MGGQSKESPPQEECCVPCSSQNRKDGKDSYGSVKSSVQDKYLENDENSTFNNIKNWLNELYVAHQKKMFTPLWSTPNSTKLVAECTPNIKNTVLRAGRDVLTSKVHKQENQMTSSIRNKDETRVSKLLPQHQHNGNACHEKEVATPVNRQTAKVNDKENRPTISEKKKIVGRTETGIQKTKLPISLNTPNCRIGVRGKLKSARSDDLLSFLYSLSASCSSVRDRKASVLKKTFTNNKEILCSELFRLFNQAVFNNKLPLTVKIDWDKRLTKSAGCCRPSWICGPEGKNRSARIKLSFKVCSTADRVRDTLIHELCHAATWILDGEKNNHGPLWKAWASKAMKKFPELPPITTSHRYEISTKYVYKCKCCGLSVGRHSKSLDLQRKRCGNCSGEFDLLVSTKNRKSDGGLLLSLRKPRAASGFALFVKNNYKLTKEKNSLLKHAGIMKLLGNQYSRMKIASSKLTSTM